MLLLAFLVGLIVGMALTVGGIVFVGRRYAAEGPLNYTE